MRGLILAIISVILIFTSSPYAILLGLLIFGYLIAHRLDVEPLLSGPGLGIVISTLTVLAISRVGIDVSFSRIIIAALALLLGIKVDIKGKIEREKILDFGMIAISSLLGLVVRSFYFLLPDYRAADTWFHASKVKMIISTGTVYFSHVPGYFSAQIIKYPPGYHALIALLSGFKGENIIYGMNSLRIFEILYLPALAYLVGREIRREIGIFAALLTNFSALYYYFVQYALLPAFTNYMIFLLSVYFLEVAMRDRGIKISIMLGITSGIMAVVHPYQYILFQATAFFTTILSKNRKVFLTQLILSASVFLVFTPFSTEYAVKGILMNPRFSNKDNPNFLISILRYSFVDNGQILFGLSLILALILSLMRGGSIEKGLSLSFLLIIFMMLDKTYLNIRIPYLSAVWNSERAFMLTTPLIPILEGIGLNYIFKVKKELAAIFLVVGMMISYPYLRIEHLASESSYLLDPEVVDFIKEVSRIAGNETVMTACEFDSGRWIPILTETPIVCYSKNISEARYLYVDTRGAGEIEVYPINIVNFLDRRVVLFRDGLWLLDLNKHGKPTGDVLSYYHTNGTISYIKDTKWFVYGWVNKNYATMKLRLKGFPYAIMIVNTSSILFSTSESFDRIEIRISGKKGRALEIYLDGEFIKRYEFKTEYGDERIVLKVRVDPGMHYLILYSPNTTYKIPIGVKEIMLKREGP
ncbi:TPA: integral membrane glycosyltransferase [Pyrococcus horikoshii]|nr:integral membrane glycosyltransferase [Pyrococcus horikoshii]